MTGLAGKIPMMDRSGGQHTLTPSCRQNPNSPPKPGQSSVKKSSNRVGSAPNFLSFVRVQMRLAMSFFSPYKKSSLEHLEIFFCVFS
jgi:hypothetical protein